MNVWIIVELILTFCLVTSADERCAGGIAPFPRKHRVGDWSACGQLTCPPHYACAGTAEGEVICCPGNPAETVTPVSSTPGPDCSCEDLPCQEGYSARKATSCCSDSIYECVKDGYTGSSCSEVKCERYLGLSCQGRFNPSACCGVQCLEKNPIIRNQNIQEDVICGMPNFYLPDSELAPCVEPDPATPWFYDPSLGNCLSGSHPGLGCVGNVRKFSSYRQCEDACVNIYGDKCSGPIKMSTCAALNPSFGYSFKLRRCVSFIYGGCAQKFNNRFSTQDECDQTCTVCEGRNGNKYNPGEYYPLAVDKCQMCMCGDNGQPTRCLPITCVPPVCPSGDTVKRRSDTCCDYVCESGEILSFWGFIGVAVLLLYIIIIILVMCCCMIYNSRKKSDSEKDKEISDTESNTTK